MGLLDDAIREHLELKRVRGADPSEVIREEREVLGASVIHDVAAPEPDAPAANGAEQASSIAAAAAIGTGPAGVPETPRMTDEAHPEGSFESAVAPVGVAREVPAPLEPAPREVAPPEAPAIDDRDVSYPTSPRRETVEQDTAEVDIQAMLGVDDERDLGGESSEAPYGVTPARGDREHWGAPPDAASG